MENSTYLVARVTYPSPEYQFLIEEKMHELLAVEGSIDYSLDEAQVDSILGKDALVSKEVDASNVEKIESHTPHPQTQYFFEVKFRPQVNSFFAQVTKSIPQIQVQFDENQNEGKWHQKWKQQFKTLHCDPWPVICPPWEHQGVQDTEKIVINPGAGFGTGTHDTTQLCLKWIYEVTGSEQPIHSALDFGQGSGILGIGMLKRGIKEVHFYDIDLDAIENAKDNFSRNCSGVPQIFSKKSNLKTYDFIVANVLFDILVQERDFLKQSLKENGVLILSGLLNSQVPDFLENFGIGDHVCTIQGDWASLKVKNGDLL